MASLFGSVPLIPIWEHIFFSNFNKKSSKKAGTLLKFNVPVTLLYLLYLLGPLGLEVTFRSSPFLKWVRSNLSKKTNNPNPSPIRNRFGLYGVGAGMGSRTPMPKGTRT